MSVRALLGTVACEPKGQWVPGVAYDYLNIVTNAGSAYIAKKDAPIGAVLTDTEYWDILVEKGDKGDTGVGIASVTKTGTSGLVDTYTITFTDGTTTTYNVTNGAKGDKGDTGNGIASITKTATVGLVDTYTITYTNGTTTTFDVTNGNDGEIQGTVIAPAYDSTKAYKIGNLLTYLGKQYYCIADAPAGTLPTNTTYFEEKSVADIIEMIKTGAITVGKATLADNFDSKMVLTDNSGYLFRTAGGSLEIGEQNRVKKIIGASVPIINPLQNGNFADTSGWNKNSAGVINVANNILTFTCGETTANRMFQSISIPAGHKVLLVASLKPSSDYRMSVELNASSGLSSMGGTFSASKWTKVEKIVTSNETNYFCVGSRESLDTSYSFQVRECSSIDLTATFGTTVANRLYALEQAQAGTGIAKAKEILVKDYYPYNVTAFTHTKTSGKVNNGFNQWDEQYEGGNLNDNTGLPLPDASSCRSKNYCECFENTAYYVKSSIRTDICWYGAGYEYITKSKVTQNSVITSKPGAKYFKLCFPNNTTPGEVCINLHWDGERDGEYEAYQEWNYPVEDIELKGILSLDASDNWVADGDEYLPSGVVDGYAVELTLANLEWHTYSSGAGKTFYAGLSNTLASALFSCNKYAVAGSTTAVIALDDKTIKLRLSDNRVFVRDDSCESTSALVTALAGVIGIILTTTPTQTAAESYTELQNDSNWGTEHWLTTGDVVIPVFSTCEYIPDLKAKLETAPESPTEDGDYIMHRENGLNSYGSLSTWLSANGYNKMQDLLTYWGNELRQVLALTNNIDFNNTAYVLAENLTWTTANSSKKIYAASISDMKGTGAKVVALRYGISPSSESSGDMVDKTIMSYSNATQVAIRDTAYTNLDGFIAGATGLIIAYEKA